MSEPEKAEKRLVLSREQKAALRQMVDRRINNAEFYSFIYLAEKYGLDPFLHEIWIYKAGKEDNPDARTVICVSRDGYLSIAQRHSEYVGPPISFVVCEGDEFQIDADSYKVHHRFGSKRGPIMGAWARCDRKGKTPAICFVPFREYVGKTLTWTTHPSAMIQKVAEAFVLKRQFGISGLVTREEMDIEDPEASPLVTREDTGAAASRPVLNVIRGGGQQGQTEVPVRQPWEVPVGEVTPPPPPTPPAAPLTSPAVADAAPAQQPSVSPAAPPPPQADAQLAGNVQSKMVKGQFYLADIDYRPHKKNPDKVYARLALKEHPSSPRTYTAFVLEDEWLAELAKYEDIKQISAAIDFQGKIPVVKEIRVVA